MSKTNEYSSKASKLEVEELNKNEMGFALAGAFFTAGKDKLKIKETETYFDTIPMFEINEKSIGNCIINKYENGNVEIKTDKCKFVKDKDGQFRKTNSQIER